MHSEGINFSNIKIFQSSKTPHDRYVVTNSFFLYSGDSIDYFNAHVSIKTQGISLKTKGTSLRIDPIYKTNKSELKAIIKKWNDIRLNLDKKMHVGNISGNLLDFFKG